MTTPIKSPKKLIEVALPLDDINAAAAREKSIRHGHPSTLHLWWARRPLAAARAVLFAQMVNDPGYQRELGFGVNKKEAEAKREALFQIIRDLVQWENTNNEEVLQRARKAIWESWRETCHLNRHHPDAATLFNPEKLPAFHDPFAGGGAIPLEAQRLGLEAYASDLNPVAVMINKAMIEIPPKFAGRAPVGPLPADEKQSSMMADWSGARGLAEDVRRYGHWMREQAFQRIGHLYPQVEVTAAMAAERPDLKPYVGDKLTVIAWLWARTVKSPNPAFSHVDVPLVRSFELSSKKSKETFVRPIINADSYSFEVVNSVPKKDDISGTVSRSGGLCLLSNSPITFKYIREEAKAKRMGNKLMAIVAEGKGGRVYLSPTEEMENIALSVEAVRFTETEISHWPGRTNVVEYGMTKFLDLFTPRQLVALTTFSDLVQEARTKVITDAKAAGMAADDGVGIDAGGTGATAYGDAIATYLAFAINKMADRGSTICSWDSSRSSTRNTFGRQAIPMTWDFAEPNPLSESTGNFTGGIDWAVGVLNAMQPPADGYVQQFDAATQNISSDKVVSTDPPYCLVAGTLIQTRYGYKAIELLQIDDEVLTHQGRFAKVTKTYKRHYQGKMQHITVAHSNQVLQITPEHPIHGIQTNACGYHMDYCRHDCSYLAQQGTCRHQAFADYQLEWIESGNVKKNDLIFLPELKANAVIKTQLGLLDFLPAENYLLDSSGWIHYQKATTKSLTRRDPLSRQYQLPANVSITPDLCRLVGYFAAEGYANVRPDGGTVHFTFHEDEKTFMEDVRQAMWTCFSLESGADTIVANNKSVRLNFYSKPLAQVFRTWCYDVNGYKRLPTWILDVEQPLLAEVLKGYWLGDGCRRSSIYEAGTNSAALAGQIRLILQTFGVVARLHVNEKKINYTSVVNGAAIKSNGDYYQIIVSGNTLPKLAELVGQPKIGSLSTHLKKSHGHSWQDGYLLPIRKVESHDYSGYVYNIETEDHSYVTSAGCVHNCDNIGYADLSDFFYVWMRRSLKPIYPNLFATMAVPKAEELVATPYRHGGKEQALCFFMNGMERAIKRLADLVHPAFPVSIYYAYKQADEYESATVSMGWASFLEAVIRAGFSIDGTWPMRTELGNRMISSGTNALASSIVLVCRKRKAEAETISRREFQRELRTTMPEALETMIGGESGRSPIAPVDLAQAAIGPGMAIFSQYAAVLNQDGTTMNVHDALILINREITDYLNPDSGNFDADTLFCSNWFDQYGWATGVFGEADTLARAKGTSVDGVRDAGIIESGGGKVRLLKWQEYPSDWDPTADNRTPIWEACHHLIRALNQQGESAAGTLLARMPERGEAIRQLAYHLYTLCERKKWAEEARAYNELISAWSAIVAASLESGHIDEQIGLEF